MAYYANSTPENTTASGPEDAPIEVGDEIIHVPTGEILRVKEIDVLFDTQYAVAVNSGSDTSLDGTEIVASVALTAKGLIMQPSEFTRPGVSPRQSIVRDDIIRRWNDETDWQVDGFGAGMKVHDVNDPSDTAVFPFDGTYDDNGRFQPYLVVRRANRGRRTPDEYMEAVRKAKERADKAHARTLEFAERLGTATGTLRVVQARMKGLTAYVQDVPTKVNDMKYMQDFLLEKFAEIHAYIAENIETDI